MKRAPITEDWSRFNRAVLEVADGVARPVTRQQLVEQPRREPIERVSEPGDGDDAYGLIARHKWRKHA